MHFVLCMMIGVILGFFLLVGEFGRIGCLVLLVFSFVVVDLL